MMLTVMVVFYIKWIDRWAQIHANEEFRLKRLDLDIDRSSWIVEVALEWQEEKGGAIPQELLDKLTHNLFAYSQNEETIRHPYEDIMFC